MQQYSHYLGFASHKTIWEYFNNIFLQRFQNLSYCRGAEKLLVFCFIKTIYSIHKKNVPHPRRFQKCTKNSFCAH